MDSLALSDIGQIAITVSDVARAKAFYHGVLGLKALFEQKQDSLGLAETLERLGAASHGAEAAAVYLRAADLWEQKLNRRDRAILCLQYATRADPQAREAWDRIRRILLGDYKLLSAFECLERQRQALGNGKSLAEPYTQLAEAALDDPERHPLGIRAAEIALELDPDYDRATAAKNAIESVKDNWRTRVRVLRQDSLEERDRRKAAYLSLGVARLFATYERKSKAKLQDALDRCFLLWPAMPDALELLVRLSEEDGTLTQAEAAIEKMANAYKEKTAQGDLWVYLGTLRLTKLDSPQATAALTLWTDWLSKGYAPNSVITNSQNTTWEEFLTGTFAFDENGTWQVNSAAKASFPTGVIQIPAENGGAAPAPTGGEFLTMPVQKDTARYATTKKIVECMTTTAGQVTTATTFAYYIPPTAAGQTQLLSQDPSLKPWVDAVKAAKGRTSDNLGTKYPKISQAMWTAVQKALSGELSPTAALAQAQQAAAKATS